MILRFATPNDADDMCAILNAIIAMGGTTAYEVPFTRETMIENYVTTPRLIACHVADSDGIIGFQALWRARPEEGFADNWAVIATFAKPGLTKTGIGSALFTRTTAAARSAGIMTIDATIRALCWRRRRFSNHYV